MSGCHPSLCAPFPTTNRRRREQPLGATGSIFTLVYALLDPTSCIEGRVPMADPTKLQILVDLRRAAHLSQERVAELFGLAPEQGRKTLGNWEIGSHPPDKSRHPDPVE